MNDLNKPIRACLVSVLPPLPSGVSLYTAGLLSGFARERPPCELTAIVNKSAKENANDLKGIRIIKAWNRGYKYLFQVLSSVIKEKPDVVHLQHEFFLYGGMSTAALFPFLLLSLRTLKIKTVVTIHGVIPNNAANSKFANAFFIPKNYFLLRVGLGSLTSIICRLTNNIIVHSSSAKEVLSKDFGVKQDKISVVPHGIGFSEPKPAENSDESTILFFGNITPSKGLEDLISAFELIKAPNVKLVIAGGQHPRGKEYFQKISEAIRVSKKSDKIITTGYVPDDEIHRLFEQCTVAVFPYTLSVSCSGGLSFALQHQKPIIVTDFPSFTEVITNGSNGFVVPPGDEKVLAQALDKLLLDKRLREQFSQRIAKDCSYLSWPNIAGATVKCYQTTQ